MEWDKSGADDTAARKQIHRHNRRWKRNERGMYSHWHLKYIFWHVLSPRSCSLSTTVLPHLFFWLWICLFTTRRYWSRYEIQINILRNKKVPGLQQIGMRGLESWRDLWHRLGWANEWWIACNTRTRTHTRKKKKMVEIRIHVVTVSVRTQIMQFFGPRQSRRSSVIDVNQELYKEANASLDAVFPGGNTYRDYWTHRSVILQLNKYRPLFPSSS